MKTLSQLNKLEKLWSNQASKYEGATTVFEKQMFQLSVDAMNSCQLQILELEAPELDIATFGDGENIWTPAYDTSFFEDEPYELDF